MEKFFDANGVELQVGDRVAFAPSTRNGHIRFARIDRIEVKPDVRPWAKGPIINSQPYLMIQYETSKTRYVTKETTISKRGVRISVNHAKRSLLKIASECRECGASQDEI